VTLVRVTDRRDQATARPDGQRRGVGESEGERGSATAASTDTQDPDGSGRGREERGAWAEPG
jgi:hypothetical protein